MRRTLALAGIVVLGVAGLSGPASADPGAGIASHGLDINEVGVDLVNAGTSGLINDTFIELINHSSSPVPIANTVVSGCDATNAITTIATIPAASPALGPNQTYLIATPGFSDENGDPANITFDVGAPNLVVSDGGVRMVGPSTQHEVKWGGPVDATCDAFADNAAGLIPTDKKSLNRDIPNSTWLLLDPTPDAR